MSKGREELQHEHEKLKEHYNELLKSNEQSRQILAAILLTQTAETQKLFLDKALLVALAATQERWNIEVGQLQEGMTIGVGFKLRDPEHRMDVFFQALNEFVVKTREKLKYLIDRQKAKPPEESTTAEPSNVIHVSQQNPT